VSSSQAFWILISTDAATISICVAKLSIPGAPLYDHTESSTYAGWSSTIPFRHERLIPVWLKINF
jgi:hypothetical protein